ncbi:ricin-type beta-trefoil lectin domain protein [Dactylosporangium sp. CA-092794]|uniref:ricin-type beta-trefoil lectin domain protein n=1 Tax=Dactylosporangium sp. CA-092794 TaxID=3239929 RepID=UPI003D912777
MSVAGVRFGSVRSQSRFGRVAAVAVATVAALVASSLVSVPVLAAPRSGDGRAQAAPDKSVPVSKVPVQAPVRSDSDGLLTRALPPVSWPSAGAADADTAAVSVAPGGLPVRVLGDGSVDAAPRTRKELSASAARPVVPVRVTVADQQAAAAAGVHGVLLQVARSDGKPGRINTGLSVDYGKFAAGFADYGARLQLVSLPECALTTPSVPACQAWTPVASTNDLAARTLTASQVSVGSASTSSTLLALTNSASGTSAAGDWTATDLSPAYSWASGTPGGDFSLGYPLKVPASLGGPQPQVSLAYSSGGVDAKTASKNGQSSVVGEGWELAGVGYVERSFRPCTEDGGTIPDLCWVNGGAVTLVFGGRSVKLIQDANGWHASSDDKLKIESVVDDPNSPSNGAQHGEYWKVTTQDGTQYYFGKVHRYNGDTVTSTNPDTASVLFEPVFGNNTNDPCHAADWCLQAYRWNLDYVVDPRGNSMTFYYDKMQSRYGPAGAQYDLSSTLKRIEYGTRAGSEAGVAPPMQMLFKYAERCWNDCAWPNDSYVDTAWDLYCSAGPCANVNTPMHFTRYRLSFVMTQVLTASGFRSVDRWDLDQTFLTSGDVIAPHPGDDTAPNLWLSGLTHTGYAPSGAALAEPQVTFHSTLLANRTDWSDAAGMAPFNHGRISQVDNGAGGQTLVEYYESDCAIGQSKINSDSNPFRCFPMFYKGPAAEADFGYFNKYVVKSVTEHDLTGGGAALSPDEVTLYAYSADGSSDTALWAHDDVDMATVAQTSWADWRGYPTVTTTHGAVGGQQTVSRAVYHRGLAGDAKKSGDDTQVLYDQRSAFTVEPLQPGSDIPVGIAGGGTDTTGALCLDIANGHSEDGAALQTIGCFGGAFQQWVRLTDGTQAWKNPITGKCLDTNGGANGSAVRLWTCNGSAAQRWLRQPDGTLKNPSSGRCLDISGYNLAASGSPNLFDCTGRWNQVWMPTARGGLMLTQQVRCANAVSSANGAAIQNQPCGTVDNNPGDLWQLQPDGSIKNPNSGRCLDVQSSGTTNGTVVWLWNCNGGIGAQHWVAQPDGTLMNPNSGKCLDAGSSAVHAQQLTIQTCTAALSQKWVGRTRDHAPLNGQLRVSYTLNNGAVDNLSFHRYTIPTTASRAAYANPTATIRAYMTRENQTKTGTWIAATSTWRWTQTDTTYDGYGLPTDVNNWGDVADSSDDACTHTDYARNTTGSLYLVAFPSQSKVTDCASSPLDGNFLAGTQILYDGSGSVGAAPTQGLPTQTNALTGATGTTLAWTKQGRTTYDTNGRLQDSFDALEHKTTTRYTPATGGPVTATTVTQLPDSFNQVHVTTVEPGHGTATSMVDVNNQTTTAQYDPLGRLTKVWLPGRATNLTANVEYTYALSNSAPNVVTTKKLGPNGNQIVSTALYDGRLRARQTQVPAAEAKGGQIVTDTQYNGRGLAWQQTSFWDGTNAPGTALAGFSNSAVQQQTRTTFDQRERPTITGLYAADVLKWQSMTSYDGNSTTTVPPAGGVPTRQTFDAAGHVTALRQYTAGSTSGAFQDTTYQYDRLGQRTKVIDPAGNQWSTSYDRLGRITASSDPDAGSTSAGYDLAGRMTSSTDGRGVTLAYVYDDLNRKTKVYDGSTSGNLRVAWTYDTVRKGALTSSTRYTAGGSYTAAIGSYDVQGHLLSTTVSLPPVANAPTGAYTTTATYNVDGSLATMKYPAAGGLPEETVSYGYDTTGRAKTMTGLDTYIADTSYYGFGPAYQQVLGSGTKTVRTTATIEEATGRLTGAVTETQNQTTTNTWDEKLNQAYTFDPAGNVTSVKETSAGTVVANECFKYDGLRELTEAWTTTAACQTGPSQTAVGGADAYWTSYQYKQATGNRDTETRHAATGDTTRTYTYPNSGTTSVRPHTITRVDSTGAVTSTDSYTYDLAGNALTRTIAAGPNQTLNWDNEGHISTVTDTSGTTAYTYDPDGNRLVAADPQGTTVYLAGFELRTQAGTTTATRYYNGVAVRTTSGVTWLSTDPHGTGTLAVNATTLTTTRRRLDPYGNPRTTASILWPTNRGYLNGPQDNTGLTHLGAREYEPATGRFISADPQLNVGDPLAIGGYTYSDNNPTTNSDPSGLSWLGDIGRAAVSGLKAKFQDTWNNTVKPFLKDAYNSTAHPSFGSFAKVAMDEAGFALSVVEGASPVYGIYTSAKALPGQLKHAVSNIQRLFGGDAKSVLEETAYGAGYAAPGLAVGLLPFAGKFLRLGGAAAAGVEEAEAGEAAAASRATLGKCSFAPDTPVVMADGSAKHIADIRPGDAVIATDPRTGKTGPKAVTDLHINDDTNLADLTLAVTNGGVGTLHTTSNHPFWSETRHQWIAAGELQVGETLHAEDGSPVQVVAVRSFGGRAWMYNLTVRDAHTYYVMAGSMPVLVHNSNCPSSIALGYTQTEEDPFLLADFADRTGAKMYTDWPQDRSWESIVKEALGPDSDVQIHFNLDGIDDPVGLADSAAGVKSPEPGKYTAWELAQIRAASGSAQARVTWYSDGDIVPSPFAGG